MIDLTMNDVTSFKTSGVKSKLNESDIDILDGTTSPSKRTRESSPMPPGKGKERASFGDGRSSDPSDAVLATWRRGDDDVEPSTKMLALIEYLKEWESTGDKTICYSQCKHPSFQ
jgi:hypothetical protein